MPNEKPMFRRQDDGSHETLKHSVSIFLKAFEDTIPPTLAGFEEVRRNLTSPDLSDADLTSAAEAFERINIRLRRSVRDRALEIATIEREQTRDEGDEKERPTERSWSDAPYNSYRAGRVA